jgi:hypothetical protein
MVPVAMAVYMMMFNDRHSLTARQLVAMGSYPWPQLQRRWHRARQALPRLRLPLL